MTDHFKTVETNTEPCIIITNDLGDMGATGDILLTHYWFKGDKGEVAPKITMETDHVIYLERSEIKKLISALEEFL